MKKIILYIFILLITLLLLLNPEKSIEYSKNALSLCNEIIIPSLFPFFVCSGLLIYSGFCELLSRLFSPVMKPLFNINSSGASAFILGLVSGYPLGAVTCCELYKGFYLSKSEAERLLSFCNNTGPLFIMGAVGVSIYHDVKTGVILYIAHILGAITVGLLQRFYKKYDFTAPKAKITTSIDSGAQIFSTVISRSVQNILTVCATVVFSSVIMGIIVDYLPFNEVINAIITSFGEFTSGLVRISATDISMSSKIVLSAFICAFAGLCVHLQVMATVGQCGLSLKPYIIGKLFHALFAAFYTMIFLKFIPVTTAVFSPLSNSQRFGAGFYMSSVFVCLSVIIISSTILPYIAVKTKKAWEEK